MLVGFVLLINLLLDKNFKLQPQGCPPTRAKECGKEETLQILCSLAIKYRDDVSNISAVTLLRTDVDLMFCALPHFPFEALRYLNNIEELHLSDNNLLRVPNRIGHVPSLRHISLNNNKITWIEKDTFSELPNLKQLNLEENRLVELKPQALHLTSNVGKVDVNLWKNPLDNLSPHAFEGTLPSDLELGKTKLQTLERSVFEPLLQNIHQNRHSALATLFKIRLKDTPLQCTCSMSWLAERPELSQYLMEAVCINGENVRNLTKQSFSHCHNN